MNELDALMNIDLETRMVKTELTSLTVIRVGTSGSLQADIPVDSFVASTHGLGLDNLLNYYLHTNNVFIAAINFAWAIRNYILLTTCQAGECPEKRAGLYLLLIATFIIQLMVFFPKIALPKQKQD